MLAGVKHVGSRGVAVEIDGENAGLRVRDAGEQEQRPAGRAADFAEALRLHVAQDPQQPENLPAILIGGDAPVAEREVHHLLEVPNAPRGPS